MMEGNGLPVRAILTNLYVHSTHIRSFHFRLLSTLLQHLVSASFLTIETFYRLKTFHLPHTSRRTSTGLNLSRRQHRLSAPDSLFLLAACTDGLHRLGTGTVQTNSGKPCYLELGAGISL